MARHALNLPGRDAELRASAQLEVGDQLDVMMESLPSAGLVWREHHVPDVLEAAGSSWRKAHPDSGDDAVLVGGASVAVLSFTAVRSGDGELELRYLRPWEGEALRRCVVQVTVV